MRKHKYYRHAIHIEGIGSGRAGLFLGPRGSTAEGPEGWLLVRDDGAVQLADGERYRHLETCSTTGALILPQDGDDAAEAAEAKRRRDEETRSDYDVY